ncbi:MAG: nitrogen fixation protein NifB, partial [Christensenellaceae bacterium]|nr:nitrogen fixation protein NifB [Christensenellaceae bacterium]
MVDADIVNKHPCYGDGTAKTGRLHLPVASACNIECRFCERKFNFVENRPGVAGGLLKPEDAAAKVKFALRICPEIAVAGIAGPGDPLATNEALRAFQDVHKQFPQLIKCLSTNGLLLS